MKQENISTEQVQKAKDWAIERGTRLVPGKDEYTLDKDNTQAFDSLLLYFLNQDQEEYKTEKAVMVRGNTGTGKTLIFEIMAGVWVKMGHSPIPVIPCEMLVKAYVKDGYVGLDGLLTGISDVLLDDFGTESREAKYMGNTLNVMEYVINERYRLFVSTGAKTHITSNLREGISEFYGERTSGRLSQMCNDIILRGQNRRLKS